VGVSLNPSLWADEDGNRRPHSFGFGVGETLKSFRLMAQRSRRFGSSSFVATA
jgi:hypothetical protein